jgi:hypothetical protein
VTRSFLKPSLAVPALVFVVAVALYAPTAGYTFVQDDRGIIALNPAAQSLPAALAAFDDPYWPRPSAAGLYRPVTILTYAVDWSISGGKPGWFHRMNALWHGIAAVLFTLVVARWLPAAGAAAAGLVFAVHPVHVEGVASIVARAELLAAAAMFAAVLCARRRWWVGAVAAAALAMFSKEHGVVTGFLILADDWLGRREGRPGYPAAVYVALAIVTVGYLGVWWQVGQTADTSPAFYGSSTAERLAMALPAVLRAASLLVWPLDLSADYGPQVLPVRSGFSAAALGGFLVIGAVVATALWSWRRHSLLAWVVVAATLTYLPTSNLLFPAGIVLAERNLYVPVALVAGLAGLGLTLLAARVGHGRAQLALALLVIMLALRSWGRLPAWEDNRTLLLTTLTEHPEAYRAHVWAAAVLSGMGDSVGAKREYLRAEELFDRDPHLDASHAYYLMTLGDTTAALPRLERARRTAPFEPIALRAQLLLHVRRGDGPGARALADTAVGVAPWEEPFYRSTLR